VHLNYESRAIEFKVKGTAAMASPTYFQKPLTTLNSHRGFVNRPANCQYLNYEGEIAAIVGKPMRNVGRDEVWNCLAGFAPANEGPSAKWNSPLTIYLQTCPVTLLFCRAMWCLPVRPPIPGPWNWAMWSKWK
jgi:hypothetical protein